MQAPAATFPRMIPPLPSRTSAPRASTGPAPGMDVSLPLRFVVTGLVSLLAGGAFLVACPSLLSTYHYSPQIVAITHLFVLGWVCSVIMGAVYQLVPVALETKLHSARLARWHFVLHVFGFTGMVWMFWQWDLKQVGHFASFFGLGAGLFAWNLGRTLRRLPRWNVIAWAVASMLGWLMVTMGAGLFLAAAKCWPALNVFAPLAQMHAHAHLGVVGVFVISIVGVSYKLLPMFLLAEIQSKRRAAASVGLLNLGLLALVPAILWDSPLKLAGAALLLAGLAVYGWEIKAMLKARKRRALDWATKYFLTALSFFAPLAGLGVILCWPGLEMSEFLGRLENLYGFLGIVGVVSFAILGMLYKIVPFLVWYAAYSGAIGRGRVPTLAELYSATVQAAGYWLFLLGLGVTSAAILLAHERCVRVGAALLLLSFGALAVNMIQILSHLFRSGEEARFSPAALRTHS